MSEIDRKDKKRKDGEILTIVFSIIVHNFLSVDQTTL